MKKRLFHELSDYGEDEDSPRKIRYEQRIQMRQREDMLKIIKQQEHHIEELEMCKDENIKKSFHSERKRKSTLNAYFTLVRDIRHEHTKIRQWIENKLQDLDDGEVEENVYDVLQEMRNKTMNVIGLGHCALTGEPLGDNTYINVCGHIFDKNTIMSSNNKINLCPRCSNKMVIPRS
jgi:vacuolar-type H+-ATPase subunit I/STV1